MIRFKETPPIPLDCGNSELQLPCVILVDTSASMIWNKDEIHKGLAALFETLEALVMGRIDICLIGFGNRARVLVPFSPAHGLQIPDFECCGEVVM